MIPLVPPIRSAIVAIAATAPASAGAVPGATVPSIVTNPTWSPDGRRVAFAYSTASSYRIVTAPAVGAGPIRTVYSAKNVDGCCDPLLWSRTGRILFDSNFTLMSVRPGGGKPSRLASSISGFLLSPNGETAAFDGAQGHSPSGIGLVSVNGGKPTAVPRPVGADDAVEGFSPDGTELVFSRLPSLAGGRAKPMRMVESVRGGAPVSLSRSGLIGASRLPAGAVDAQWSPDGRWIAFVHLGKLEVVGTAGGAALRVLAGRLRGEYSWSPSSRLLVCLCGPDREHLRLTAVSPEERRTVLWTNRSLHYLSADSVDRPQWSPDGSKLVFLARVGPGYSASEVWVVGADGTGLERIA